VGTAADRRARRVFAGHQKNQAGDPGLQAGEEGRHSSTALRFARPRPTRGGIQQRWTFRLRPTPAQRAALARTFGACRFVYNYALALRKHVWTEGGTPSYGFTSKALTELKRDDGMEWLSEVSCVPLQQSLRHLDRAYANFFEGRARYPTFKKRGRCRDAAEYTRSGFSLRNGWLVLGRIGKVKVRWSRKLPSMPTTATVYRDPVGRYFVSFVVKVDVQPKPKTGRAVGIDLGVNALATLSTGEKVENPKHFEAHKKRLAYVQRRLARSQKGSNRRAKTKRAVAKLHGKIRASRQDALHKLSTRLVTEFDHITIETLNVTGMIRGARRRGARGLSDASMGALATMIEQKAAMYGKECIRVSTWYPSSKTCSACGCINEALGRGSEWACPHCGVVHDRDENAASNLLAAGRAASARGDGVRVATPPSVESGCLRSVNHPNL